MSGKKTAKAAAKAIHAKDRKLGRRAAKLRDTLAARLTGQAAEVADQPPLFALAAVTIAGGLVLRQRGVARAGVRMLAAHGLATAAKSVVKRRINRTRPAAEADGHDYRAEAGRSAAPEDSSFPSGHSAGAVAVATAAAHELPAVAPVAGTAAGAVAAAQLPSGKHYLGDVIAGALIGWASAAIADAVIDRLMGTPDA